MLKIRKFVLIILLSAALCPHAYGADVKEILKNAGNIKGGLLVLLNCGDGEMTAGLGKEFSGIVHGIDTDSKKIALARKNIIKAGFYGRVSADTFSGKHLPYIDNSVNLIISVNPGKISMKEMMRILSPNGEAHILNNNKWERTIKPRPKSIDEWTHYLHGADNNAVAMDTEIDIPLHMQWVAGPKFLRSHSTISSLHSLISANGRIFYIIDEGHYAFPSTLPAKWMLICRDAFNGITLWERSLKKWQSFTIFVIIF